MKDYSPPWVFLPLFVPPPSGYYSLPKGKTGPFAYFFLLPSAGGLILREDVLRKRLIPREKVWLRDASVGGRTGNLKDQATADRAATPWRRGPRWWLTKAHVAQEGTRERDESLLGVCMTIDTVPQIFLWLLLKARPSTSFHVSRETVTPLVFHISKFVPLEMEKEMETHSTTLAWKILWTEESGKLQSVGSQGVGHDWATSFSLFYSLSFGEFGRANKCWNPEVVLQIQNW